MQTGQSVGAIRTADNDPTETGMMIGAGYCADLGAAALHSPNKLPVVGS